VLELFKQFIRQAHGPAGVVSDRAIDNFDLKHGKLSRITPIVRKL
jgi:hypothetical protein